jgi:hypothetical protein
VEYEEAPAALAAMQALHTKYHWTGGDTTMVVEWMDPARHRKDKQAQEEGEARLMQSSPAAKILSLLVLRYPNCCLVLVLCFLCYVASEQCVMVWQTGGIVPVTGLHTLQADIYTVSATPAPT